MHQTTIRVRWGELDPYNHVNHAVYSSYLEHARVETLEQVHSGMDPLTASGVRVVVVRSDVRFRAPATAGDVLVVTTGLREIGAATMIWRQVIDRDDVRIVEADIHTATIGEDGRPIRIPPALRAAVSSLT